MATIDERIAAISFENAEFERRIAQTLASLGKLDTALKDIHGAEGLENIEKSGNKVSLKGPLAALDALRSKLGRSGQGAAEGLGEIEKAGNKVTLEGPNKAIDKTQAKMDQLSAGKTFTDIERASNQVELAGITKAIDSVTSKFSLLQNAASVAIGGITANAAMKGASFAKSFALGPITDGLDEYKTNLNSIQTILSNTEGQQVSGLDEVNKHLGELNTYSDQTIYNFSEMARNIGTFTAAGVDMDKSTSSIKGIANLAALSGSNSEQASRAMQQLSQAIASGRVGLQDWNSVVNAGMGGAVFQKALMRTAENMGAVEKGAVKIDKATGKATVNGESFRNSIMAKPGQESWLTSDVLVNTLGQLTGDMTDAQLAAQGFTAEQIKAIQAQAKTAKAAATEVKTLPQVFDVARETIGSGWAQTFQFIFGDFEQSKKTFTAMSNFINGWINNVSKARNKMLGDWAKLGGRGEMLEGIKTAFNDVLKIILPIKNAFRAVFPASTGKSLFEFTKNFHELMEELRPSQKLTVTIRHAFEAFFTVLKIGWAIVKETVGVIADLLGVVGKGSGGFLDVVNNVSLFVTALGQAILSGGLLENFFKGLSAVLKVPLHLLAALAKAIINLFTGNQQDAANGLTDSLDEVNKRLGPLKKVINVITDAWGAFTDVLNNVKTALDPWLTQIADKLKGVGQILVDAFTNMDFDNVMNALQAGFVGAIFLTLKKAFGNTGFLGAMKETLGGVNEILGGLTSNLEVMQKKVNAEILLTIAGALLALAAAIFILSTIDGDKLAKSMTAVAIGLGELMGGLKLMTAGLGKFGALKLPLIAAGLIGVSIAVIILAGAMKIFATMSWEDIGKGIIGVAGALGAIAAAMTFMPTGPMMVVQAGALLILGVALSAIGAAVKIFASMKFADMGKGLFGLVEALGILAFTMGLMPPNMLVSAAALVVMGVALNSIGLAINAMGSLDFLTIVKGLGAIIVAIAGIGIAMALIPPNMVLTAGAMFIMGNALIVIAKAIGIMGNLSIPTLIKGLTAMAAAMGILAVGLYLMIGTAPGALAMLAAAAAFAVLAPVLAVLGTMKWSTIFKGLATIGLVLITIGTAGLIAAPALAALGLALIPLGLGFMLVAGAAKIFASAIALLSESGQKGLAVFLTALTGFMALLPTIIINFLKGLVGVVSEIAKLAPTVIAAIGKILELVIAFVSANAVKLAAAIGLLVDAVIMVIADNAPKLVASGIALLGNLLNGISQNIGQVTNKVSEIINKFLAALTANMPKLIDSGAKLLQSFLLGISSKYGMLAATVVTMISRFVSAVATQYVRMVGIAANLMLQFIGGIAKMIPQLVAKAAGIVLAFIEGLGTNMIKINAKGAEMIIKFIEGIGSNMNKIANKGADAVIKFLNSLADTIRTKGPELRAAGWNVAQALIEGIWQGLEDSGGKVMLALKHLAGMMPGWMKKILGIKSPSTVFAEIGRFSIAGLQKGIDDTAPKTKKSMENAGTNTAEGFKQGFTKSAPALYEATGSVANGVITNFQRILGIHSPSEVFRDIGMNVNRGFRDGLLGSKDDVISAFEDMNSTLIDKIRDLRGQVEDGNKQLQDLQQQHADKLEEIAKMRGEKKPDNDAIADAVKESEDLEKQINEESVAVNQNSRALTAARNIRKSLTGSMKDEKAQLLGLKKDYEDITKQLDTATSVLEQAQKDREEAQNKYTDQYSAKPDIDKLVDDALAEADLTVAERQDKARKAKEDADKRAKINQVALYQQALQEQIVATEKYQATLQKLRDLGLDDETYSKLLDKGLAGQEFASQLLTSGKAGIDQINKLNAEMLAKSTTLAKQAADNLYNAGISAAQGLVDGLTTRKSELEAAMTSLADVMVKAIKSKLKIKSPSRIFMEVGKFTAEGLAQGLKNSSQAVTGAASALGDDATEALTSSLSHILNAVGGEIDPTLTITPVLDMTQLRKDAAGIKDLSNVIPITTATSYGQASATSQEVSAMQQAAQEAAAAAAAPSLEYTQNNYSPEALNDVEIYRKTRNQLGQLKSALGIPA